jgi:Holliday junction resolvase RusA-like endonuclease
MIQLNFNLFPLSTNKLYVNIPGQKRRFVSTEGKKFKATIEEEVKKGLSNKETLLYLSSLIGKKLTVLIEVTSDKWFLKDKKTIRMLDIENTAKALLDSIFTAYKDSNLELDDKQIFELKLSKKVGLTDSTLVQISELL